MTQEPSAHRRNRRLSFVLVASDQGTLVVNRFDHYRFAYGVGFQIMETGSYEAHEIALGAALLDLRRRTAGDGVVAVDCGANIGVHSVPWARHLSGWGSVVAVEAQEWIYYALAGNIAINNCFNARAIWGAVSSRDGTIKIPVPDYQSPASFGSLELRQLTGESIGQDLSYDDESMTPVPCLTLDALRLDRVDLIKIDVEGMELEVLEGAADTLQTARPILLIEFVKVGKEPIVRCLERYGYAACQVDPMNICAVHRTDPALADIGSDPALEALIPLTVSSVDS